MSSKTHSPRRPNFRLLTHHHLVAALGLLLLVVVLRLPGIGSPLGIDEGGMTLIGAEWLRAAANGDAGTSLYGNLWVDRPPLILATYGLADLLGGELAVRVLGTISALMVAVLAGTVASRVTGRAAWAPTAWIAGALLCSPAIDADRTAGELLAAVPAAASMAILLAVALRDRRRVDGSSATTAPWFNRRSLLFVAGVAAACAPLVKQSALDAGFAAAVWFAWRVWADRGLERGWRRLAVDLATYAAGVVVAVGATVAVAMRAGTSFADLSYALVGFRVDVLVALGQQSMPPAERAERLLQPAMGSGLLLVGAIALVGIVLAGRSRLGGAGSVLIGGWIVGAVIGVAGGGYYWAHYLIQLAPPLAVAAGIVLAHRSRAWTTALVLLLVFIAGTGQVVRNLDVPPKRLLDAGYRPTSQQPAVAVADAVRRNSAPTDRVAVLYARANIAYYADRTPATPYLWSSMYRALPEARNDLLTALSGPDRAAWVVAWQRPGSFGMDKDGKVSKVLADGYTNVAVICGRPLLMRNDRVLKSFVLPAERCPTPGPELVLGGRTVTRGFTT